MTESNNKITGKSSIDGEEIIDDINSLTPNIGKYILPIFYI
jgi:hypothetical protein